LGKRAIAEKHQLRPLTQHHFARIIKASIVLSG
jgi:hypothetical protein